MSAVDFSKAYACDARGAAASRSRAHTTFRALETFAKTNRLGNVTPKNLTPKQLHMYLDSRKDKVSMNTLQNEMSQIRRALTSADRQLGDVSDKNNNWSNTRMGIANVEKAECKKPADLNKYKDAKLNYSIRIVTNLQRDLGLRKQEAIKATNLKDWSKSLDKSQKENHGAYLELTSDAGSKGGRPRHIYVPLEDLNKVSVTVNDAIKLQNENGGNIVDKDNLKDALKYYDNVLSYADLNGDNSGHGLRRAFSCARFDYYLKAGLDAKTALSRLCGDLGHGDDRGRWVYNNYIGAKK